MGGSATAVKAPHRSAPSLEQQKYQAQQKIAAQKMHKPAKPASAPAPALSPGEVKAAVRGWLDNQLKYWMSRISATQDAIHMADMMYQAIMASKAPASPYDSALEAIVIAAATAVAPELVAGAGVFKIVVKSKEVRQKAAELIVDMTKEAIGEVRKTLEENENHEDTTQGRMMAVKFFRDIYQRLGRTRDLVTVVNVHVTGYIDVGIAAKDPALEVKLDQALAVWQNAGFLIDENQKVNPEQLSLFFLYDLMHEYCKQYVYWEYDKYSFANNDVSLKNLDSARREAMFEFFKGIKWHDPRRPPVTNWDELLDNWSYRGRGLGQS